MAENIAIDLTTGIKYNDESAGKAFVTPIAFPVSKTLYLFLFFVQANDISSQQFIMHPN